MEIIAGAASVIGIVSLAIQLTESIIELLWWARPGKSKSLYPLGQIGVITLHLRPGVLGLERVSSFFRVFPL